MSESPPLVRPITAKPGTEPSRVMARWMDDVDRRLGVHDDRLDAIETAATALATEVADLTTRIDTLEARVTDLETRADALEAEHT